MNRSPVRIWPVAPYRKGSLERSIKIEGFSLLFSYAPKDARFSLVATSLDSPNSDARRLAMPLLRSLRIWPVAPYRKGSLERSIKIEGFSLLFSYAPKDARFSLVATSLDSPNSDARRLAMPSLRSLRIWPVDFHCHCA